MCGRSSSVARRLDMCTLDTFGTHDTHNQGVAVMLQRLHLPRAVARARRPRRFAAMPARVVMPVMIAMFVVAGTACGGAQKPPATPVLRVDDLAMFAPRKTRAVAHIQMQSLRSRPVFPRLRELFLQALQIPSPVALQRATEIVLVGPLVPDAQPNDPQRDGQPPSTLLIVRGHFTDADVVALMDEANAMYHLPRATLAREQHMLGTVIVKGNMRALHVTEDVWVLGRGKLFFQGLDAARSPQASVRSEPWFSPLRSRLKAGASDVVLLGATAPEYLQGDRRAVQGIVLPQFWGVGLDFTSGLTLQVRGQMRDDREVQQNVAALRNTVKNAPSNMLLALAGLSEAAARSEVRSEPGRQVVLVSKISDKELDDTLARAGMFAKMLESSSKNQGPATQGADSP